MPTIRPDITIKMGSGHTDVSAARRATDDPTPFVSWVLPDNIVQRRFNVRIANLASNDLVYQTSGIRQSSDQFFQFPPGIGMSESFAGTCKIEVSIGTTDSGEMQFVSAPFYFVYDRQLEVLRRASSLTIQWDGAPDPDELPADTDRYQLQVASDWNFSNIAYDNQSIVHVIDRTRFVVPGFIPSLDTMYFYRVRRNDGLDWGAWSTVNAFFNSGQSLPSVEIHSATHTGNAYGDVVIRFTITDSDSDACSVSWSYSGGAAGDQAEPMSLFNASAKIPPGTHEVTWRSSRQEEQSAFTVTLYAAVNDGRETGPTARFGPVSFDNSYLQAQGGGFGSPQLQFAMSYHLIDRAQSEQVQSVMPIHSRIGKADATTSDLGPVSMPRGGWWQHCGVGRLESWPQGDGLPSAGLEPTGKPFNAFMQVWNIPGDLVDHPVDDIDARINPHTSGIEFLFYDPTDYRSDGWPRPHDSREMVNRQFLHGYIDLYGTSHEYPDGYDFDRRPAWHRGREVWADGDAWVQILQEGRTDLHWCTVCGGKGWAVSGAGPYSRTPCTGPGCVNGFDTEDPYEWTSPSNPSDVRRQVKSYFDVRWVRLSSLVRPYDPRHRYGFTAIMPEGAKGTVHLWGRSPVDTEAVRIDGEIDHYLVQSPDGTRRLPGSTVPAWLFAGQPVDDMPIRQKGEGIASASFASPRTDAGDVSSVNPASFAINVDRPMDPLTSPVQHFLGNGRQDFTWGADPASHPGHAIRPTPTQAWGGRVSVDLQRVFQAQELRFVFLQSLWDAYNTIHWRMTGSETSKIHLQASRRFQDGSWDDWRDVPSDNGQLDGDTWLVPPLQFHAYWNTVNRALYQGGLSYQLRLRMYDTIRRSFSGWAYSPKFNIVSGVSNPVSVIGTTYEPWTKFVTIRLRLDDSEADRYTLTGFWYSSDDGVTWNSIARGDIAGETVNLSSASGSNEHQITWMTEGYSLPASNSYRLKIECQPTSLTDEVSLPFFKWNTPINPVSDPAENRLVDILGRIDTVEFDTDTQQWAPLDEPRFTPGQIELLQMEQRRIQDDPSPGMWSYCSPSASGNLIRETQLMPAEEVPDGWILADETPPPTNGGVIRTRWFVSDQESYQQWLAEPYAGRTRGDALRGLSSQVNGLVNVELPRLQEQILQSEAYTRKRLIDQGYYAESHFIDMSGIKEMVAASTVDVRVSPEDSDAASTTVNRYWRFRVQSMATGPEGIVDASGIYAPEHFTDLEVPYYKLQMDATSSFDSQSHSNPLREWLRNDSGQRLSVARFVGPASEQAGDEEGPWSEESSDSDIGSAVDSSSSLESVTVGGELKVSPQWLPGQVVDDQLADGQESFEGPYHWRVCAYNVVVAPVRARPRPLITSVQHNTEAGITRVDLEMRGHKILQSTSLPHWYTSSQQLRINDGSYQISTQTKSPQWEDDVPIIFVSDRRAPAGSFDRQINPMPWVPAGTDRPRLWCGYDDEQMQYLMVTSKIHFNGRWRPVTAKAMAMPDACEYEGLFRDHAALAIYGGSFVKVGQTYFLYMTIQQDAESLPRIAVSTSTDFESWSTPTIIAGIASGAYPSAAYRDGTFHLWFESFSDEQVVIQHAVDTGDTGSAFAVVGSEFRRASGDACSPGVIWHNGAWVMYFHDPDTEQVRSVYSVDAVTWAGEQAEIDDAVHATPMLDRFKGNLELFLLFNRTAAGQHTCRFSRLEDRVWVDGQGSRIFGNRVSVPCDRDGATAMLNIDVTGQGMDPTSNLKIRVNFSQHSPTEAEFHRQSQWVTSSNAAESDSRLLPNPWTFSSYLLKYPYLVSP